MWIIEKEKAVNEYSNEASHIKGRMVYHLPLTWLCELVCLFGLVFLIEPFEATALDIDSITYMNI